MTCVELVRGSIYSVKGGNRYDDCPHAARFTVNASTFDAPVHVCGVHVRKFRLFNEHLWRNDDALKRPRRAPHYEIEPIAQEVKE